MKTTLEQHRAALQQCRRCPLMIGPVVAPPAVVSRIYLVGQAPGPHEGKMGRPFGWTAGKTLFSWFSTLGVDEAWFRENVYMAAVCRCFPGKASSGGDRVPLPEEIANCRPWMEAEVALLDPTLILPVGKLAIAQVLGAQVLGGKGPLADIVGKLHVAEFGGRRRDVIPLPHPSGASTWHRMEPGKTLLATALGLVAEHPSWKARRVTGASGLRPPEQPAG